MKSISEILIVVGLFLLFLVLGQAVVLITLALWYGVSVSGDTMQELLNIQKLLQHPDGVWVIFYMQATLAIFGMGISGWVYRAFFASRPPTPIHTKPLTLPATSLMVAIMLCALPAISYLVWLNKQIDLSIISVEFAKSVAEKEQGSALMVRLLTSFPTLWHFAVATFVLGLVPALMEEFWFRGILQNKFIEILTPDVAIWTTGFIFSLFHFQFEGFLARWVLGALFGYLYLWSGNLWVTVIGHFVNNFVTLVAIYLFNHKYLSYNFYEPTAMSWYWIVLSVLSVGTFIYLFKTQSKKWTPKPLS